MKTIDNNQNLSKNARMMTILSQRATFSNAVAIHFYSCSAISKTFSRNLSIVTERKSSFHFYVLDLLGSQSYGNIQQRVIKQNCMMNLFYLNWFHKTTNCFFNNNHTDSAVVDNNGLFQTRTLK